MTSDGRLTSIQARNHWWSLKNHHFSQSTATAEILHSWAARRRTEASNNSPPSYLLAASKMQLSSSPIIDGMLLFRGRFFFRKKSRLFIKVSRCIVCNQNQKINPNEVLALVLMPKSCSTKPKFWFYWICTLVISIFWMTVMHLKNDCTSCKFFAL